MNAKKLKDYIKTKGETSPLLVAIEVELRDKADAQRKIDGLTWRSLVEGFLKMYLDQSKVNSKFKTKE